MKERRIWISVAVDDDVRAAVGHRFGKKRATEADIRMAIEGAIDGWFEDVMDEWRHAPEDDDDE